MAYSITSMVLQWVAVANNLLPTVTVQGPQELPSRPAKASTPGDQNPIKNADYET